MQCSKLKHIATRIFYKKYYIKERNRFTRRFECINHEFMSYKGHLLQTVRAFLQKLQRDCLNFIHSQT